MYKNKREFLCIFLYSSKHQKCLISIQILNTHDQRKINNIHHNLQWSEINASTDDKKNRATIYK